MNVSIVMATWMGERFIEAQLQSFLQQTTEPDELVIRDDGSTDNTLEIIRAFSKKSSFPVRVLPPGPRLGYAMNFATVLKEARGEIVFLSDQDDFWLPDKIERGLVFFENNPHIQLLINDLEMTHSGLERTGISKLNNLATSGVNKERFITGCATSVRKSFLNDVVLPFPQGIAAHDWWLHFCANALGVRAVLPEVLQLYRRHESNASAALISMPRKLGSLEATFRTLLQSPRESYVQQLLMTRSLLQRLIHAPPQGKSLSSSPGGIAGTSIVHAVKRLDLQRRSLEGRVHVLESAWPMRAGRAFSFWMRGGYDDFQGVKSLIRDALPTGNRKQA